jgi:hypothetical protein
VATLSRVLSADPHGRRATDRLRALTSRRWGVSMERRIDEINLCTVGWTADFRLAGTSTPFEDLDEWLRRRLRQVRWKEWKRPRTRRRNLRALGINETAACRWACSRKGTGASPAPKSSPSPCATAILGRPRPAGITGPYRGFQEMLSEPTDASPHVRWCGGGQGEPGAYPIRLEGNGELVEMGDSVSQSGARRFRGVAAER